MSSARLLAACHGRCTRGCSCARATGGRTFHAAFRSRRRLWDGNRLGRSGKVAVGARGAETPLGLFYVTDKFDPSVDPDWAILGAYAFETSAYSRLTDWPRGGIVGVHGTPWPNLLGQAVSHGCIRMHNRDIEFLRSRVPRGTPVKIVR
jgi:lipoprotein-anchoring transpeptidase ErfK/SrfK